MMIMRGLLALLLVMSLSLTLAPAEPVGAQTNAAVAINTKDGFSIFRLSFAVRRVMKDVVDVTNAAVAVSSCSECQTVAVSIQTALIMSDPEEVTATNLAIAINQQCNACSTLAAAYQYVLTTDGPVKFTTDGWRRIVEIRRQLQELRNSDLTVQEIAVEVDRLATELESVLAEELRSVGTSDDGTTTPSSTSSSTSSTSTSSSTTSTTTSTTTTSTTTSTTTTSSATTTQP